MADLPGFLLAAFALAGSPGPNTLSLAATGAAFGARRGLGYLAGLTAGMVIVMTVTATGAAAVLLALPGAAPAVAVVAGAYFLWLAWRIATAPPLGDGAGEGREPSFPAGVLLSLVNPKAWAAMAALFTGFVLVRHGPVLDAAVKIALLVAVIVAVNIAWLNGGALLTRLFRDPTASRIVNVTFAVLLVVSVAFALLF